MSLAEQGSPTCRKMLLRMDGRHASVGLFTGVNFLSWVLTLQWSCSSMLTVQKTSTALSWYWHLKIETEALADKRNYCGGSDVVSKRAFNAGRVSTGHVMYSSRGKKMVRTDISFVSLMVTMRDNGFLLSWYFQTLRRCLPPISACWSEHQTMG